jgi:hypothetical protein
MTTSMSLFVTQVSKPMRKGIGLHIRADLIHEALMGK